MILLLAALLAQADPLSRSFARMRSLPCDIFREVARQKAFPSKAVSR